jgi:hypothetical protein
VPTLVNVYVNDWPVVNEPLFHSAVLLVLVCVAPSRLVHRTLEPTVMVMTCGLNAKLWILFCAVTGGQVGVAVAVSVGVSVFVGVLVGVSVGIAATGTKAMPLKALLVAAVASTLAAPDTVPLKPVVSEKPYNVPPPVEVVPPVVAYRFTVLPTIAPVRPLTFKVGLIVPLAVQVPLIRLYFAIEPGAVSSATYRVSRPDVPASMSAKKNP